MHRFIGLFDSGMGGLTVLNQIIRALPDENTVYLGDMGRAPYGSRSTEVLNRYSAQIVKFLLDNFDLKLIVAACDTISTTSLDHLKRSFDFPIMGIIEPVPPRVIETTRNGRVGIIGTRRTIESGVYQRKILGLDASIRVFSQECPLLMHVVEEGWAKEPATELIIAEYLANLKHAKIDTLVMGCTHYPILRDAIHKCLGDGVTLIDPAAECLKAIRQYLTESEKLNKENHPERIFLVTDNPGQFRSSGERYLDRKIHNVNMVEIGALEKCDIRSGGTDLDKK